MGRIMVNSRMNKMDRLFWTWALILSVFSLAVVAYRNDLSSTRHGCIWSTMETKETVSTSGSNGGNPIPQSFLVPSYSNNGGVGLNCNLRTLSVDFWNYTFNREQVEQTKQVRIKCSDKLFFESLLSPNQTLFQLRNLQDVQIESCKIRKVPKRVWATLTKLRSLVIRTQNTEWSGSVGLEVEEGAFEGLVQLELLDLSENNIWTFPQKNVLCPLRALIKLNVSRNRLSDIEELSSHDEGNSATGAIISGSSSSSASAFASSSVSNGGSINRDNYCSLSVQNLDLSFNALRRVGSDGFTRMKRLTELRLQNNLIAELEDHAFGGLSQLKLLNLSSNRLVALPPFIFKSNSNLRELYLQNNTISALSSQVFHKMDQLLLLELSRNTLTSQWIKEDMFHGLIRLVVLKLSWNQLSYMDSAIFRDLISLQALHLDNNRIETINPEAFHTLSNLHILDLSNNRLTYVDSKVFSNLFVLRQLYIDHNKIRKFDEDSLRNCTSLQDLGIADNALLEVPVALKLAGLGLLKTLDIGENKIVQVTNESFSGMSQLYGLRLVDNRLTELPNGFCSLLKELRVLNLSQNRINKISPVAFNSCPQLRVLRLDTNALEELPTTLAPQLPSLLWLNVSENRLRWADYRLLPESIEWLDLSYNSVESLVQPHSLTGGQISAAELKGSPTYSLRVLDVSYNKLKHLDSSVIPPSLETLRVNHNELQTLGPDTFIRSPNIRRVELIGNLIENLPLTSLRFSPIPSGRPLPDFYLGDNPFLCDCTMEWLTRVSQLSILRQHPRIVDLDAIVCRTSFSLSTNTSVIPLVEARPRDFLCPYKSHCFALCHCCDFDACDCEMTCPDNCTCFHDTAWSSNIVQCSNLDYSDIPSRIPMDATEIYLDGNRIFQLGSHIFIGKKNLRSLYLNDSHVEFIRNKTFNGLRSLEVLHLEENVLTELNGYEFLDLENLRELYLQNNLLRFIASETFTSLKFLQVLRLDGNLLVDFNVWELSRNGYLNSVMLAGNPWSCECEFLIPYRNWVATKTAIVVDFTLAKCQMLSTSYSWTESDDDEDTRSQTPSANQPTLVSISAMCNLASTPEITFNYETNAAETNEGEINNHISAMGGSEKSLPIPPPSENHLNYSPLETENDANTLWALVLCLTALLLVVVVILLVFRQEIYYWTSNSLVKNGLFGCPCCPGKGSSPGKNSCPSQDEIEKLFDAYFVYSKTDEDVLLQKIAPELELVGGPGQAFRLCLHYRDLCLSPESPWNREMILSACDASKRVVILLSRSLLQNEWSSSSLFRQAIQSAISLHQKKLIFIFLPQFTEQNLSSISPELKTQAWASFLKSSCIEWTDKNFWSKFRLLLPQPSCTTNLILSSHDEGPGGGGGMNTLQGSYSIYSESQLPYNLIINPNLSQSHNQQISQSHYHHQNIIPYQIPMNRNNDSLPPIPKHQIILPAPLNYHQQPATTACQPNLVNQNHPSNNSLRLTNPHHQNPHHHHPAIIPPHNHSLIHPIPSQLTPQQFGYSNEAFHLQSSSNHHQNHHPHPGHNQPIHFLSTLSAPHLQNPQQPYPYQQPQPQPQHHHQISVIPPHSHSNSQVSNSNFSSSCYPLHNHHEHDHQHSHQFSNPVDQAYSSSAVSSGNEEFDHVYSTLDSPMLSPNSANSNCTNSNFPCRESGGRRMSCDDGDKRIIHKAQHSTSSGVSSGSDMTSGDMSSNAVSPSSPVKIGILSKLITSSSSGSHTSGTRNCTDEVNGSNSGNNALPAGGNNGKMYFV